MTTLQQYIRENIYCRCEHLMMRLSANNLLPRREYFPDECDLSEWWLVSKDLAARLRAADLPVLDFTELYIWGRASIGGSLEDDMDLIAAIGSLPAAHIPEDQLAASPDR